MQPSNENNNTDRPDQAPSCTLSEHVKYSLENYFSQLNGHDACAVYQMVLTEVEKPLLETVLKHCGQNQSKAAKTLGLSRSTLRKKMALYNID